MKTIVLFYSHSGQTRRVATALAARIGATVSEIKTAAPIRHPYAMCLANRVKERNPEIALDVDPGAFDAIYVGGPVWAWTVTPPLLTLFRTHSFAGKTVVPFCTNDSQPGNFLARAATLCAGADVKPGFEIQRPRKKTDEQINAELAALPLPTDSATEWKTWKS